MSGNPNWNPPLQTSSVRFPRKAVETPVIPANSTTRQRPGAPFQPVFSSQITIIPTISSSINGSGSQVLSNALYTISSSYGDALAYNVTRRTMRGVPAPEVLIVASAERYLIFTVSFPYPMAGTDHFVFTFKNQYTNETLIKNYKRSPQYLVGGILPGVIYTLTVAPHVNGITYPASPPTAPFSITAVSEKNIRLQGVTLSGADKGGYVLITGATPLPPIAFEVTKLAVDDNFGSAQQIIDLVPPSSTSINRGYVFVSNLTNGSSYILTVRSVHETGGVYEYGQPTSLPPYIPGPPSDIYFTSITANVTTAFLSSYYDTDIHPTPVSNRIDVYKSSFSTLCSYILQPTTYVQDLSETYASFTTSTSLFTTSDISSMIETVSATPGSIQVEITNNHGYWYTFPLTNITSGGLGYTFGNSNFTKTVSLATETVSAYTIVFHSVRLSTSLEFSSNYLPPETSFIFGGNLQQSNYTFVGRNFANGLPSLRPTYTTIAVGEPYGVTTISAKSGNHIVTLSFSGYDELSPIPRPRPTRFLYSDTYGNTYTTINSNITINGLTNASLYTFTILPYANTVYGPGVQYSITPVIQPPSNLTYEISNYNVTLSFTPAIGGADFYAVEDNSGHVDSSFPYAFVNLSANFPYVFTARSGSYNKATYTLSSEVAPDQIRESPVGYAQFFVGPSTIPYVENVRQLLDQFVPYIYTITSSGQPIPSPIQTISPAPSSPPTLTASGSSLLLLKYWSIAATTAALSGGYAVTASARGISYTVTSITTVSDALGNLYNSFNGGPSSLSSLAGQNLTMEIIPVSNAFTFPIRSIIPVYDESGILTGYTIENSSVLKSVKTFSGATTYTTVLTAGIPFYQDMVPTDFSGTVYSVSSLPTTPSAYVGPPGTITFTASSYLSQEILLTVSTAGFVNPTSYTYLQVGGTISGTTTNSNIEIKGLTDGSSYSFYVNAFGNLAAGPSSQTAIINLCTDAPRNLSSSFSNLTATLVFAASVPPATTYYANMYKGEYVPGSSIPIQSVTTSVAGQFTTFSPVGIDANTLYSFVAYGVLNGISSTSVKVSAIISGPPFTPTPVKTFPSSNQIIFNWSSGNIAYTESYRITEYYSNNPTGGIWGGIVDLAKTISAVVTTSLTQSFGATQWAEVSPGYASFVLSNGSFTNAIDNRYLSNLVYITILQSGNVSYTFPATQSSNINTNFNAYFNTSYPKTPGNLFNPTLSVSVTYSWGTGPFNYGTYSYTLDALANQVYSISSKVTVQMFTLPVSGVPTVSVSGTTATISFADTGVAGVSYNVTNNFGSNVSTPPYEFRNLLTTSAYTFSVVSSNGTFTSISSESTLPTYVGPPRQPEFVSSTYYGRTVSAYATDTTLSLGTFFYDTGTQGTGNGIGTISHANVIQTGSGNGYWSGGNGNIKDTLSGFVVSVAQGEVGSTVYSNDGITDAIYQFMVTPSIGTVQVSLSSYLLSITGGNYIISRSGSSLRTGTITISSYPIQFVSRSNVFAIQTGLSSLYYTTVPALTDALTISLAGPASFSNFTSYSLNQTGVATVSYVFTDNLGTTYDPITTYPIYSLSGITYTNTLTGVLSKNRLVISVTPYANNVSGIAGTTSVFISTESPGIPVVVFTNTNAVVTVPKVADNYIVENYNLATYSNGVYTGKQTQIASAATSYTFNYTGLTNHANYYFEAYTENLGISSELVRSTPTQEAGSPYSLVSLTPTFTASSYLLGTYSISAVLDVGLNSNGTTSVHVYKSGVFVASNTKSLNGSSLPQTYTFSVSSGAVYTLSSSVVQNTVVTQGPVATISAVPFSPQAVGITISSSDIGVTYKGIVSVNVPSSTTGVTYKYLYSTNDGASKTEIASGNTFTAPYGLSYIGYAYAVTAATPTLSSSITSSSTTCNVTYESPSNAVATYLGSNITVNWSAAPVLSYYTVRETGGQLTTQQNITGTTAAFVGTVVEYYLYLTNPTAIPNCVVWLDALDAGTITQNNGRVLQWMNKATTNRENDFYETGDYSGQYSESILYSTDGGFPVVKFNNGDYFASGLLFSPDTYTIFITAKATGIPSSGYGTIFGTSWHGSSSIKYKTTTSIYKQNSTDLGYTNGYSVNGSAGIVIGGAITLPSGYDIIDTVYVQGSYNELLLGGYITPYNKFIGNVAEVIIYRGVPTPTQRAQVQTYLSRKWNITMAAGFVPTIVGYGVPTIYQFSVLAQSGATNDRSLLYSLPSLTNQITLATSPVTKLNIDYFGNTITLSWANIALNYVYTISQTQGPTLTDFKQPTAYSAAPLPTTDSVTITNVPLSNTYSFAIKTNLFGVSGLDTSSFPVTLSTGPMTNVSQSYYGNVYTISWAAHPQSPATYTVQEINGNYQPFSLQTTVCSIILSYDTSYTFQTFATYKGISGTATTLSAIYTYTLPIPTIPVTTYTNRNITVSWSAAPQEDGSLYPDSYLIKDILNIPSALSGTARSLSESIVLVGSYNMSYQFMVTPSYKGIAGVGISGFIVSLYTPPPTNVIVDNSGRNLYIRWNSVVGAGVTYSISQKYGTNVMNGVSSGLTTTTFLSPLTAGINRTISYNFGITALLNGISSAEAVSVSAAYVYTYPPANVGIYYLGEPSSNTLTVYWTISSTQTGNSFYVKVTDPQSTNPFEGLSDINSSQYIIRGKSATSNHTYTPFVYAIRNGLSSEETTSGTAIRLFTPQPSFVGAGFDGNYAITVNVCAGPDATPDTRFKRPDTYTLTETSNLFFPKDSSWTFSAAPIAGSAVAFQIPTLAAKGLTYNFSLYATMCGLVSIVDPSYGVKTISITTNPVSGSTLFANNSGTIITISWEHAKQPALNTPSNPNGGYTLYVSSLPFPLTTLYKDTSFRWAGGVPGGTYQFSVEATNNNVGSALVTSDAAIVTLYKPTVQFLTVTNSGGGTTDPSNVKMILDWFPDPNVESETYIASLFNSVGMELSSQTLAANAQTATFNGSLGATYFFRVVAVYRGICGDPYTATITNTRPVLTSASVLNNGTQVIVTYTANVATLFNVSMRPTNGGTVIPGLSNNSSYSFTVTPSTGIGYNYSISVQAYYNGLPSLPSNLSTTIIQPGAPATLTARYSNTLISASWGNVTTASSYTFQALDLSTGSYASVQPSLTTLATTFTGTIGHSFSLGVYAFSSTQVVSAVTTSLVTLVIPPAPSNLSLSNTGQTVIVNWSEDATVYNNYSFYVSNVNQRGVIVYSTEYARSGDTFQGSIGQTYSVSLYGTSLCNITSTDSVAKQLQVYQPYVPFVSATNTGADIFLQWPRDEQKICVFYLTNNYTYCNLLFPDPTGYTESKNGWIVTGIGPIYLTNPTAISNCITWLDAADANTVNVVGGKVTQWNDKSGLGNNFIKYAGYTTNPITTIKDGTRSVLTISNGDFLKGPGTYSGAITTFMVAAVTGVVPNNSSRSLITAYNNQSGCLVYTSGQRMYKFNNTYNIDGSAAVSVDTITVSVPAGYNIIDMTYNMVGTVAIQLGVPEIPGANTGFVGNIAEVLVYNRILTTTERAQIQTYLSTKWTINMVAGFVPVPISYGAPPYVYTHDPKYDTSPTATLSANYTQVGGYVKYTVSSNAYNTAGTAYIFSVKPFFNQAGGNTVTTNEQDPIILYQPTQVGDLTSTIVGNALTLNWQYAVVYTNPAELVQSYMVEICAAAGAYISCNVVGTTQTFGNFTENSGVLSISVTAVAPSTGYEGSKIYGTTKFIQTIIPSLNRVSIKQSLSTSPQTIDVTIPPLAGTYIWFATTVSAPTGVTNPPVCNVFPSMGSATQQTYRFDVTLGYKYTISAYGWPTNTGLDIATAATIPANEIPYPVTTFAVVGSTLSTSHYGSSVTVSWGAVAGAGQYDVQEYNADGTGNGGTIVSTTKATFNLRTNGSSYTYKITANCLSADRYTNTIAAAVSFPNTCNFTNSAITETLTIPFTVPNLLATQSGANAIVSWLAPTNIEATSTALNTQYSVSMFTNTGTLVSNKNQYTDISYTFPITAGSSYRFTVNSQYYGIWATLSSGYSLTTINPIITSLTLTDNANKTATLSGSANTTGDWYYTTNLTTPIITNTNSFSAVTATQLPGASISYGITFLVPSGLTATSNSPTITFPSPTITKCSVVDNQNGSLTLNLSATIGGSGTYTSYWTVPQTVGTLTLSTAPANLSSATAIYKTSTAGSSYTFTGITVSADGFTSDASSATLSTPSIFSISDPTSSLTLLDGYLRITLSVAGIGTTTSPFTWTLPSTIGTGVDIQTSPGQTAVISASYGPVSTNATLTFPANSIAVKYQGYSVSYASAVTYTPPNPLVSATTSLTDNLDTTFSLNLSSTGTTGGYGNVVWTVPGTIGVLSISGTSTFTGASGKVTYTGASANTSYAVSIGAITVSYSGISSSNSAQVVSAKTDNPLVTNITASYFGSTVDTPTNNSITLNLSGNIPGTWTITKPTSINFTTSSGQGTTNAVYNFSGGTRESTYTLSATLTSGGFTSSVSSTSVTLAVPGGTTPTITSVKFHFNGVVVDGFNVATSARGIALGCTTTDTNFTSFQPITVTSTTDTLVQSSSTLNLNTNILYTLFVANQLNGILGDSNTCNIVIPGIPTGTKYGSAAGSEDRSLATSNSIYISWSTPAVPPAVIASRFTYSVYKDGTMPTQASASAPTGSTLIVSNLTYSTTNYEITSLPAGAQKYFVLSVYTEGLQKYYSAGAASIEFTYGLQNYDNTNGSASTFTQPGARTYLVADVASGKGGKGAGGGNGESKSGGSGGGGCRLQINGGRDVVSGDSFITYPPATNGGDTLINTGGSAGTGGTGTPATKGTDGFGAQKGGGGGGAATKFIVNKPDGTSRIRSELGGGGGGAGGYTRVSSSATYFGMPGGNGGSVGSGLGGAGGAETTSDTVGNSGIAGTVGGSGTAGTGAGTGCKVRLYWVV